jgi:Holliday junction resolvasome RuvABC DNA-binding subunit
MTGPALLLAAEHADPHVAAREARRRLGSAARTDDDALVAAVVADGFSEQEASEAVASLADRDQGAPTGTCASGVESYASDD